jgi:hypothetical protein
MSAKLVLFTGATILSLVFGSAGISAVLPDEPGGEVARRRGARVYGVIESIENEPLMLATPLGSVALITDVNTVFRVPGVEDPGLDDLAVGDVVAAAGWWEEESSTFHAFGVAKLADDRVFPLAGTLAEISRDTLVVEIGHGPATVHVDDETVVRIPGVEDPGLDDLEVGMRVAIKGTLNLDGSLQAHVVAARAGSRRGRLRGEVLAVEGDTFTLRTARDRELTVLTDETTEFRVPGVEDPTIVDLEVGDKVAGEGVIEQDGTARATLVAVLPEQVARLAGEVAAIERTTLVLNTPGGQVDVLTDADTVLRIPGVEDPSLEDIKVGDKISAVGTWEDETTFHAIGVAVGGRREGQRGVVRGRVVSVGDDSLVVGSPRGPVTVLVDGETQFRVPGVEEPGLDDVETGALVAVRGTWNEGGTLRALGVAVLNGRGGK